MQLLEGRVVALLGTAGTTWRAERCEHHCSEATMTAKQKKQPKRNKKKKQTKVLGAGAVP